MRVFTTLCIQSTQDLLKVHVIGWKIIWVACCKSYFSKSYNKKFLMIICVSGPTWNDQIYDKDHQLTIMENQSLPICDPPCKKSF